MLPIAAQTVIQLLFTIIDEEDSYSNVSDHVNINSSGSGRSSAY